jgi:hypothetical protein
MNPLFENFGAHLCLHVSGQKKIKSCLVERSNRALVNDINRTISVRIVGYIQMDEQLYLRWLPHFFHLTWLNEFGQNQHLVHT